MAATGLAVAVCLAVAGCAGGGVTAGRPRLFHGSAGGSGPATGAPAPSGPGEVGPTGSPVALPGGAEDGTGTGDRSGVSGGALFGGDLPLAAYEGTLGRTVAIVRDYYILHPTGAVSVGDGEPFPTASDSRYMSEGTTVLVSLDVVAPGPSYAAIASGRYDPQILTFLRAVEASAIQYKLGAIYVSFEHEADNPSAHGGLGTTTQFVRAWDHIHALAASAHMDWQQGGRIHWVLILMHTSYYSGLANLYWPGTSEVDIVAADGYNKGGCARARGTGEPFTVGRTPVESPADLFNPLITFANEHGGLPTFVAEWGSVPYPSPTVRPMWIHQMEDYVAANHEIAAALYWDSNEKPCDYNVDSSPLSFAALSSMADSPVMQGQVIPTS